MVEIIPKTPQASPLVSKALSVVSLSVFAISLGGFALLFVLESQTQGKIEEAKTLLGAGKTQKEVLLEQEVFQAKARLQDFAALLLARTEPLEAFSFLENVVHPSVTFTSLTLDNRTQTLQLKGQAGSFFSLAQQIAVLQAREEPSKVSLTSLQLAEKGGVDFQMEIQFPISFFQQKQ